MLGTYRRGPAVPDLLYFLGSPFFCRCVLRCETKVTDLLVMLTSSSLQALDQSRWQPFDQHQHRHQTSTHASTEHSLPLACLGHFPLFKWSGFWFDPRPATLATRRCHASTPPRFQCFHASTPLLRFYASTLPTAICHAPSRHRYTRLDWTGLRCAALDWTGLDWTGRPCITLPGQDEMRWDEARESASLPTPLSNAPGQPRLLSSPVGRWVAYVAGLDMQSHPLEPGLVFVLLPMH